MLTATEIPAYRCLAVSLEDTTLYFRRYLNHWVQARCADDDIWYETAVPPDIPETVCGYYPHRTLPLSDYPV